jgi:hypothetical protein
MKDQKSISWMKAKNNGISRKEWCATVVGNRRKNKHRAPKRKEPAKPKVIPLVVYSCVHRGDVVDVTTCKSCGGGNKPLEIFECSLHGECTVDKMPEPGRTVKGLCKVCKDRQGTPII